MSQPREDFWSRRKARVAKETLSEEKADSAALRAQTEADLEERPDAEILAELDLPDPDTLTSEDDFSAFMKSAVPDRIRRRALRVLWRSNPVLANVDGLVDYGEDYTDAATVVADLQTSYQVGKGMLKHVMVQEEAAKKRAEALENPAPEEEIALLETEESDLEGTDTDDSAADPAQDVDFHEALPEPAAPELAPTRRRMRFDFAQAPNEQEEPA